MKNLIVYDKITGEISSRKSVLEIDVPRCVESPSQAILLLEKGEIPDSNTHKVKDGILTEKTQEEKLAAMPTVNPDDEPVVLTKKEYNSILWRIAALEGE